MDEIGFVKGKSRNLNSESGEKTFLDIFFNKKKVLGKFLKLKKYTKKFLFFHKI